MPKIPRISGEAQVSNRGGRSRCGTVQQSPVNRTLLPCGLRFHCDIRQGVTVGIVIHSVCHAHADVGMAHGGETSLTLQARRQRCGQGTRWRNFAYASGSEVAIGRAHGGETSLTLQARRKRCRAPGDCPEIATCLPSSLPSLAQPFAQPQALPRYFGSRPGCRGSGAGTDRVCLPLSGHRPSIP